MVIDVTQTEPIGVALDFDGVLIDSVPINQLVITSVYRIFLDRVLSEQLWKKGSGLPLQQCLDIWNTALGIECSYLEFEDHIAKIIRPMELSFYSKNRGTRIGHDRGLRRFLRRLQNSGIPYSIVTSNDLQHVTRRLACYLGLAGYFSLKQIITASDVQNPKPHAEPLLLAAKRMGLPAQRLIMIGDSEADWQAARNVGALSIGYMRYKSKRVQSSLIDVSIQSFDELHIPTLRNLLTVPA